MTNMNNANQVEEKIIEATMDEEKIEVTQKTRKGFLGGIKAFVKEHKKAIIIGGVTLAGAAIGLAIKNRDSDDHVDNYIKVRSLDSLPSGDEETVDVEDGETAEVN